LYVFAYLYECILKKRLPNGYISIKIDMR